MYPHLLSSRITAVGRRYVMIKVNRWREAMWEIVRNRHPLTYKKIFPLSIQTFPSMAHFPDVETKPVRIPARGVELNADLTIPPEARGIVAFAHGSGSGRHSPRNRYVAEILNRYKFATLLADLLTEEEEIVDMRTRHLRFDIPMLANRLIDMAAWLQNEPQTNRLKIGWFGASTGAGAALIAAARRPENITAVVSRGGRPDLAGDYLSQVRAPVLLIVGENDPQVLELNESALARLNVRSKLEIVPRATHLFEEPGTLEIAARLAAEWFQQHSPPENKAGA
jgi:putative phosphoribosyl transferase